MIKKKKEEIVNQNHPSIDKLLVVACILITRFDCSQTDNKRVENERIGIVQSSKSYKPKGLPIISQCNPKKQ